MAFSPPGITQISARWAPPTTITASPERQALEAGEPGPRARATVPVHRLSQPAWRCPRPAPPRNSLPACSRTRRCCGSGGTAQHNPRNTSSGSTTLHSTSRRGRSQRGGNPAAIGPAHHWCAMPPAVRRPTERLPIGSCEPCSCVVSLQERRFTDTNHPDPANRTHIRGDRGNNIPITNTMQHHNTYDTPTGR
jgi:hypothetical protein